MDLSPPPPDPLPRPPPKFPFREAGGVGGGGGGGGKNRGWRSKPGWKHKQQWRGRWQGRGGDEDQDDGEDGDTRGKAGDSSGCGKLYLEVRELHLCEVWPRFTSVKSGQDKACPFTTLVDETESVVCALDALGNLPRAVPSPSRCETRRSPPACISYSSLVLRIYVCFSLLVSSDNAAVVASLATGVGTRELGSCVHV